MVAAGEVRTKNEPVAARQYGRFLEPDAGVSRSSRRYGAPGWGDECRSDWDDALFSSFDWCTHGDSTDDFAGPLMEAHSRAVPQWPAAPEQVNRDIEAARHLDRRGRTECVPTREFRDLHAAKIDRHALSRDRLRAPSAMDVEPSRGDRHPPWQHHQFGVLGKLPCYQRSRHHGAEALHAEDAIDRQPRRPVHRAAPYGRRQLHQP